MIRHQPFSFLKEGSILAALTEIYAEYPFRNAETKDAWTKNWREYDRLLFSNLNTVGTAGFATFLDDSLIGFCSWDPRGGPGSIIVGHNGILPGYRGHGYGRAQIRRMLEIFRERGYAQAYVTTGDEEFFLPAQRMYAANGFQELERLMLDGLPVIRYGLKLP
jgi:GNAT superfamily N-acetyltransferase